MKAADLKTIINALPDGAVINEIITADDRDIYDYRKRRHYINLSRISVNAEIDSEGSITAVLELYGKDTGGNVREADVNGAEEKENCTEMKKI